MNAPRTLRPALHYWLKDHDRTLADLAAFVGVTTQQVSMWCLPWDNPRRQMPTDERLVRILEFTGGEIGGPDFYPPRLRGRGRPGEVKVDPAPYFDVVVADA